MNRMILTMLIAACVLVVALGAQRATAQLVPRAEVVRFQLVGNEPIASPDGRALVTGWSALVFSRIGRLANAT